MFFVSAELCVSAELFFFLLRTNGEITVRFTNVLLKENTMSGFFFRR